jgi:hypothetical protein
MGCRNQDPQNDASIAALRDISEAAHERLRAMTSDRWGVWCRPKEPYTRDPCGGRLLEAKFAEGPDGELVLFETVAVHLAAYFNEILQTYEHEARRIDDPGDSNEVDDDDTVTPLRNDTNENKEKT